MTLRWHSKVVWVRMCGKLIRSTTNYLDVQRTADASREIWKKNILHRKEFWLYITFDLSLLRFFITENICWKTHFLSWWLSNLPLTTADTILFMPLPLVTKETSPTNQLYSILQTEARMIERTLFSKTFTGLTSSTCLCLKGYVSSADEDERTEHTEFIFLSRSALRLPLWLWSVSWYNSSAS